MKKNRMIIVIIAAVVIAGIGFGAGMMVKSSVASKAQITADEAKQIALASVGVSEEKASFTRAIFDEGVYEVDFYTSSNEYDFEISADTGAILEREVSPRDLAQLFGNDQPADNSGQAYEDPAAEATQPANSDHSDNHAVKQEQQQVQSTQAAKPAQPATQPATQATQAAAQDNDDDVIGVDAAKSIALKHAGVSSASFMKAYLDYDDGIRVYDIEFTAGNKEYDYEINAYTGKILDHDVDHLDWDD